MIAAPVVSFGEIDQFAADARRSGRARQFAHAAGHLPVMIAVGQRRRFACRQRHRRAGHEKTRGRGQSTQYCNPRPLHSQYHSPQSADPMNARYGRMRLTITSNARKDPDVNILKSRTIIVDLIKMEGHEFTRRG
jgi:hypothetical protein